MKTIDFKRIKRDNQERMDRLKVKKLKEKEEKREKEEVKVKKKRKRRRFRFFYWLTILFVLGALTVFVAGIGFCYYIVKSAPEYNIDKMFNKESTRIFDSRGNLIASLGTEQRQKVKYEDLPQVLVDAIIATEDSRFFQHNGFDAPRFIKASISQVLGHGGGGASTLTMQLSKLAFTSTESRGFDGIVRKFTDIYMAVFKMEKNLTKEEIIEYYVNTPCMGGSIYGVQQASRYYFGKDVQDINLVEAAQLAGMFQSPNGYNPYNNPNDANARKNTVLYLMKRHGYITEDEYQAGISREIKTMLKGGSTSVNEYQGFIDTVVQEVIDLTGNNPYDVPMDIYSTMNKEKQDAINNFYKDYDFPDDKFEVGIGVVENKTGAILAVGAGRNKTSAMTLNVATFSGQTKRMPGSTAKPIVDYGPAIEYENLSTYGPFIDDKTPYGGGNMRNFNGSYSGFMTMRDCLKKSINTCALQAFRLTTNEQKKEFAGKLGVVFNEEVIPDSYAIGAWNGVSPVQLASAYTAFGNNGKRSTPHSFTRLVYRETEEEYTPKIKTEQVMKPTTAYMIANVLTSATSSKVRVSGTQVATKTGTTSYDTKLLRSYGLSTSVIPDSWTSSFTSDYAMAIWIGYVDGLTDDNVDNGYYMLNGKATTWRINIQAELAPEIYETNAKFTNPGGLSSYKVELETIPAKSPSAYTPSDFISSYLFVGNTGPSETSDRFSKLSNPSNVNYNINGDKITLSWTSPGTPNSIDKTYLTNWFNDNWKIETDKYLDERFYWNDLHMGNFGFGIYLTNGSDSEYVTWTSNTSYTIDMSKYPGKWDGAIVKSIYTKFTENASDGYKVSFTYGTNPTTPDNPGGGGEPGSDTPTNVSDADITVKMDGLDVSLAVGSGYTELSTSAVSSIKYLDTDITNKVSNLSVITGSVSKEGSDESVTPSSITESSGKYYVNYSVSFTYANKSFTRSFKQTVIVN